MTLLKLGITLNPMDYPTATLHAIVRSVQDELARRDEVGETEWTTEPWTRLLEAVRATHPGHAQVLDAIGKEPSGEISRDEVLKIMGRAKTARITGFRKPYDKTVERLHAVDPGFPDTAPVWVDYAGTSTAQSFYVEAAALPYLREAISS